jgi:hypothetical protein
MTPRLTEVFVVKEVGGIPSVRQGNDQPWPPGDMFRASAGNFPEVPTTQLKPGSVVLLHGTAAGEDFKIPRGPASFTTSRRLAKEYATMESDGYSPRVMSFRIKARIPKLVALPSVYDREQYRNAIYWCKHIFGTKFDGVGFQRMPEVGKSIGGKGYEGYFIRKIDGGGDEVMLLHPERYLEPVGEEAVG